MSAHKPEWHHRRGSSGFSEPIVQEGFDGLRQSIIDHERFPSEGKATHKM
jgi:hypothetical protein